MVQVKSYKLPPTKLIPNSPQPLLHYPKFLKENGESKTTQAYDLFHENGWELHWIFRYGPTQTSHYHSAAHECMAVLTGSATIRFGAADTSDDLEESTHGSGREDAGVEVHAEAGDVFIIPAGVAHKTFDTTPAAEFALISPGDGHGIPDDDERTALQNVKLEGFTMLGAYPKGGNWDFAKGGEEDIDFNKVWAVAKPENDPVLGKSVEGLCGLWT